ncbi:MAG: toxin-antitoxin system HicB family antitoxin [Acidobacteriota bacterium]
MARLSLRLPDSLHQRLTLQARREGVPLNQLLVFLLAEQSRPAYTAVPAESTVEAQRTAFAHLRERLGSASEEEVWKILDEREPAPTEVETGWTPELRQALEQRIEAARRSTTDE